MLKKKLKKIKKKINFITKSNFVFIILDLKINKPKKQKTIKFKFIAKFPMIKLIGKKLKEIFVKRDIFELFIINFKF